MSSFLAKKKKQLNKYLFVYSAKRGISDSKTEEYAMVSKSFLLPGEPSDVSEPGEGGTVC